jgi:hypothetical protein
MSQLRYYVDEDAQETAVVRGLQLRGIDVVTARDAQLLGVDDAEQLTFAISESRVIYTLNVRDYSKLHREFLQAGKSHAGIVAIPDQRYSIGEKIRRLAELASRFTAEEMVDRMEYV